MRFQLNKQSDIQSKISQVEKFVSKHTRNKNILAQVVTLASEIIYNIIKFSSSGEFRISIEHSRFVLQGKDDGKGFASNVENSFTEGYSSVGSLGLGLPSIVRMCDDFELSTSPSGTDLLCIKEF
ncbi:ATP-binding protein [Sulfurospirillum arcachonense]|uniref:ATP-binding protein n=1 Tax=Sulfurospirillum arcachonense TaxID=57666 RepID=UPI00046A25D1|nr:ATP-binding protein [Sulfurospirillum arcachonense]